jgi:hypothetical protein
LRRLHLAEPAINPANQPHFWHLFICAKIPRKSSLDIRTTMDNPVAVLENLREILNKSIEVNLMFHCLSRQTLKANMNANKDAPLDIESLIRHPVYSRGEKEVVVALKNIGAVGKTLEVYSDPGAQISKIFRGVRSHQISIH